jgi:hypothetical protein
MTKRELAEKIATEARLTTKAAETVLESFTLGIREALRKGRAHGPFSSAEELVRSLGSGKTRTTS